MKLFSLTALFISLISAVLAADDYQITHYGCPRKCSSQEHASCGLPTYPLKSGGTRYFCALSTHLPHYDDYCGKRVVLMLTDGSKNMINVQVVDSCSSCPKYHVDLSSYSFEVLLPLRKGEADCIWGVFDNDGRKLAGPIYKSVSRAAEKFGMSSSGFVDAFVANASRMAKNGNHVGTFGKSSGGYSEKITSKKTTTSRSTSMKIVTKIVPKPTQAPVPVPKNTSKALNTKVPKTLPLNNQTTKVVGTKTVPVSVVTTKVPVISGDKSPKPTVVGKIEEELGETGGVDSTVGFYCAIGGTVLGAAGLGLLLMKKKSPSTYEDMKQKFPEAFSQIKRGVSRSATSIKRKVTTRRTADQYV